MNGGLMQLVSFGAQDIYLTGNPSITYFKVIYRRHTNFAMESIEQTFNGVPSFGNKVSCVLARNADLIAGMYLQFKLPPLIGANSCWTQDIGHHLIDYVSIEIGGQEIDRQWGDWLEVWAQLSLPAGKEKGYREMIGQDLTNKLNGPTGFQAPGVSSNGTLTNRLLYVPMQFWFCRNPGLALPLIALQYHSVKVNFSFKDGLSLCTGTIDGVLNASLWVDYVYLDTDERRRFTQVSHEYLIEQVQDQSEELQGSARRTGTTLQKIKLQFLHPVKEIVWFARNKDAMKKKQWSNWTAVCAPNTHNTPDLATIKTQNALNATWGQSHTCPNSAVSPITVAKIKLNGLDRFETRPGSYFNLVETLRAHTSVPKSPGLHVYSFALNPESYQPSGSCNFSKIDNAYLYLGINFFGPGSLNSDYMNVISSPETGVLVGLTNSAQRWSTHQCQIKIYAVNYNVLRIMSGLGGLAYTA